MLEFGVANIILTNIQVFETIVRFNYAGKFREVALSKTVMLHCKLGQALILFNNSDDVVDGVARELVP